MLKSSIRFFVLDYQVRCLDRPRAIRTIVKVNATYTEQGRLSGPIARTLVTRSTAHSFIVAALLQVVNEETRVREPKKYDQDEIEEDCCFRKKLRSGLIFIRSPYGHVYQEGVTTRYSIAIVREEMTDSTTAIFHVRSIKSHGRQ